MVAWALCCAASSATAIVPSAERDVLLALYAGANGADWTHNDAWNGPPGTECTWYGITCDATDSHITAVELRGNELTGSLPGITRLINLVRFDVGMNALRGPVPSIAGMSRLEYFAVDFNQLDGELAPLGALGSLTTYMVSDNHLSGHIPSFAGVPHIAVILVHGNALSGAIPPLAGLSQLETFSAFDNDLTGSLPPLPDELRYLNVGGNRLIGRLPAAPPSIARALLCPNAFDLLPDASWDAATGQSPWYVGCQGAHLNLDQFGVSGSWYDPSRPGQGILLSSMPNLDGQGRGFLFGGWFTFAPQASTEPSGAHWFSIQGEVGTASQATLDLYETLGGSFDAPPTPTTRRVGSALLYLSDCQHGLLGYHFDDARVPDSAIYMARLTQSATCTLTGANAPPAYNSALSGAWFDPEQPGQGFVIDLSPSQGVLFGAWYTFAANGASDEANGQRWYSLQGSYLLPDATSFDDVVLYESASGVFNGTTDDPVLEVGRANLRFDGCNALTVEYAFDAPDARAGTLHLARLGPAPAGCD